MSATPTFDDVFAVMAAASYGDGTARVALPDDPQLDHIPTKFGLSLNVLLDDLSFRVRAAEQMAERLRLLASAAREFAGATTDHERLLDAVAARLATIMGDVCVVMLVSEDGQELIPTSVHASDASVERRTREFFSKPLALGQHPLARRVREGAAPFLSARIDMHELRANTTAEYFDYAKGIGLHSVLILQLRTHGQSLGQVVLSRYRPETPSFNEDDVEFASALADHAALAISNARSYAAERAARATAEKAQSDLRASEERYRLMFDQSPLPKWMYDATTLQFLAVNEAAIHDYGYSRDEFLTMSIKDIRIPEDVAAFLDAERDADITPKFGIWRHRKKSGALFQVEVTKHSFLLGGRRCRIAVGRDVTERIRLEEQLRQSQKMEAVGRLAGGVAHDFNNVLSVILCYGDLLLKNIKPGDPTRDDVEEIRKAGSRAAALTRQLLMFSRQQVIAPKVLDLNEVLASMDKMLQRILGADVDLVSIPARMLGRVRVDPSSIEQVIMNLVVNSRDAMPTGGKLTMETCNVVLDEAYAADHLGVKPGPHVMLAVTDSGIGMDKATQARIFEPFFTTKESGKGTGMGLSTVFGIVQQSGGSVWVYSEPGRGTTFKVYIPRVDADLDTAEVPETPQDVRGSETILLVEDDDQVRTVARGVLRQRGYHVIEGRNAGEALLHSESHPGVIDLLLSDVVMPQMSGPELAKRLAKVRPEMKVLCMSGYTDDSIVRHGVLEARIAYLQKPFTPDALALRVREVLGAKAD